MAYKKCLVLDLDNTLWGGVLGEDGLQGIKLGLDAEGAPYLAFQQAVKDLYDRGVLLALASKNNHADAMEAIEKHPDMILRNNHFGALRINWNDKVESLKEIAEELNLGLDSLVFLDDSPMERGLMRTALPEVEVPDMPENPEHYAKFLFDLPYFPNSAVTDEDKMRGQMYVTERLRKEAEGRLGTRDEFLQSLSLETHFFEDDVGAVARLAQMTEKTNQFNTNKVPMTDVEILRHIEDDGYKVFHISARDKFGDYGIIGFALVKAGEKEWLIESLLMSCRILGRGIEEAFLHAIHKRMTEQGGETLRVLWKPTEKNTPAAHFLGKYFTDGNYVLKTKPEMPNWVQLIWKK